MAPADVETFRATVVRRLGLQFEDTAQQELAALLQARIAASKAPSVERYLARLDGAELGVLAERLTVNETYFFRYREQLDAFVHVVLPWALARQAEEHRPVRILSAGCASGEEPYTLAILAREHFRGAVEIHACDVNPAAVARARQGRYSPWSLRETPAPIQERHFGAHGGHYTLAKDIRDSVMFAERNLIEDDPAFFQPGAFDVVFCRNVIMYFSPAAMRVVVDRLARALRPDGFLFLGHAETLRDISQAFELCQSHDTFFYRRLASVVPPPGDASWVDSIHQAAARVTKLAEQPDAAPTPPADTERILEMMRTERFAEALEVLSGLHADRETVLLRAVLLTNAGRHAEAEELCAELAAGDPSAGVHYLFALCREHAGDLDGARDHDRIATTLDDGFAMAHLHLGMLERRGGRRDRGAAEFRRALDLLPFEDASRLLLFGGGFGREALVTLCRSELQRCGVDAR